MQPYNGSLVLCDVSLSRILVKVLDNLVVEYVYLNIKLKRCSKHKCCRQGRLGRHDDTTHTSGIMICLCPKRQDSSIVFARDLFLRQSLIKILPKHAQINNVYFNSQHFKRFTPHPLRKSRPRRKVKS